MRATKTEKIVIVFTLLFLVFTIGVHLGTGHRRVDMTVTSAETPVKTEAPALTDGEAVTSGGKININTATAEELQALDGIGEALAGRIVAYREENGDFEKPEDIRNVSGIGNGIYSKICDDITVK